MPIQLGSSFSKLDWFIFLVTCLLMLVSVVFFNLFRKQDFSKKLKNEEKFVDYFLMGRNLSLPLFVSTLVATFYGGIIAVSQITYKSGIYGFFTQGVFWYLTYLIFAFFLVDKIRAFKAITLPELVQKLYGKKSAFLASIFSLFSLIPVAYVISLGIIFQAFLGGDLIFWSFLAVIFVVIYSLFGGFQAVVISDIIQSFLMFGAVLLVFIFSLKTFGDFSFLKENLPSYYFKPTSNQGWLETLIWFFFALSVLVNPNFYQRCFAAKNGLTAKLGILISTFLWILFDLALLLGVLYAKAAFPNLEPESSYLVYFCKIIPNGLKGFVLVGIVATVLSTIDSCLFLASTNLTYDLFKIKDPKKQIFAHKISVVLIGLFSVFLSCFFQGDIKAYWKLFGSYISTCLLFPILSGYFFPNKISDTEFVAVSLVGVVTLSILTFFSRYYSCLKTYSFYLTLLVIIIGLFIYLILKNQRILKISKT